MRESLLPQRRRFVPPVRSASQRGRCRAGRSGNAVRRSPSRGRGATLPRRAPLAIPSSAARSSWRRTYLAGRDGKHHSGAKSISISRGNAVVPGTGYPITDTELGGPRPDDQRHRSSRTNRGLQTRQAMVPEDFPLLEPVRLENSGDPRTIPAKNELLHCASRSNAPRPEHGDALATLAAHAVVRDSIGVA